MIDGGIENAERARARERAEADHLVVAALLQFGQRDLGDGRGGRRGGARHRAEDAAGQHVDVHQPAREPVEPGRQAAEHLLRQPGAEQDLPHPDEQRQRGERPRRAVAPDRGRQHRTGRDGGAGELHAGEAAGNQRDADPQSAGQQRDQQDEQQQRDLEQLHLTPRSAPRARPPLRRSAAWAARSAAGCPSRRGSIRRRKR